MIYLYASYFNILKLDIDVLKLFFTFKPWVSYALIKRLQISENTSWDSYVEWISSRRLFFLIMFWNKRAKTERKTSTQEPALYKTYFKLHYVKKELFLKSSRWKKQLKLEIRRQKWLQEKHRISLMIPSRGHTESPLKRLSSSSSSRGEEAVKKHKRLIIMFS